MEQTGRVLAAAPRSLTREHCLTAVRILRMTTEAPLLVRASRPAHDRQPGGPRTS